MHTCILSSSTSMLWRGEFQSHFPMSVTDPIYNDHARSEAWFSLTLAHQWKHMRTVDPVEELEESSIYCKEILQS